MHILVVNDDGPPSNKSSPYVHSLISSLQAAGHTVSVILPHVQRSWIGKAHLIGQTLTPTYFRPGTLHEDDGITSSDPFEDGKEEWVLVDGTPASCVQIGTNYLFQHRGPIDVVVSGPNYGRNTTAVFCLSSGTLGGALEAAVCGKKAIALSYAFDSRDHDAEIIVAASKRSCQLIEKLVREWPKEVQVFNINVPLKQNVREAKILYTYVLENQWSSGSSFELVEHDDDPDPEEHEKQVREGVEPGGNETRTKDKRKQIRFKWAPKFRDVWASIEGAPPGNDGWATAEGIISVTPLRANFVHVPGFEGEIQLPAQPAGSISNSPGSVTLHAIVEYPDAYVQPIMRKALEKFSIMPCKFISSIAELPAPDSPLLQFRAYEAMDFEHSQAYEKTTLMCSYVIRKALIRKHFLARTVEIWLSKHPQTLLQHHVKSSTQIELDFAEFLDDALVDAWDLNESLARNEEKEDGSQKDWWILKAGMSDGANGIRIFSSMNELQRIFEEWDGDEDTPDDTSTSSTQDPANTASSDGIMTSHLRHFVAQPYISYPLLLSSKDNHKFHIRVYVLAVGALKVYVHREMLALFASKPYQPLASHGNDFVPDLAAHLTNTCRQEGLSKSSVVSRFWDLAGNAEMDSEWKENVFDKICEVSGEVFEAAARCQMVYFQCLPNAFEVFGVDFLVDVNCHPWLLEVNAYPDFQQTGPELRDVVIGGLFEDVINHAVLPFFSDAARTNETPTGQQSRMRMVRDLRLGQWSS